MLSDLPQHNQGCYGPLQYLPAVRSANYLKDKVKQMTKTPVTPCFVHYLLTIGVLGIQVSDKQGTFNRTLQCRRSF